MFELVSVLSQLIFVFGFGVASIGAVVVVVVSVRDFHEPWRVEEVRYAVLRERYCFAIAVHAALALFVYAILVYLLRDWGFALVRGTALFDHLQRLLATALQSEDVTALIQSMNPPKGEERSVTLQRASFFFARYAVLPMVLSVASITALLIMVLIPRLPPFNVAAGVVRRAMQDLARYPQSAETMAAVIGHARLNRDDSARTAMLDELARYGVSRRQLMRGKGTISKIAAATLEETYTLYLIIARMEQDDRFRKFFLARCDAIEGLKQDHNALTRRAARAILAAEDAKRRDDSSDLTLDISEFVAEEADILRTKYQRILADACLSMLPTQATRQAFLSDLGYDIALPKLLPLAPLVIVLVLDLLIGLTPIVIAQAFSIQQGATLRPRDTVIFATAHAIALTAAIILAIWPKAVFSVARPSLTRLPLPSYALFGAMSYVIGVSLFYATFKTIAMEHAMVAKHWPLAVSLVFGTVFPVATCGISILLDRRLREPSFDFWRDRRREGIALGLALGGSMIPLLAIYYGLEVALGLDHPWQIAQVLFVLLYGMLGFAMGYLLPSAIEAHLEANQYIIDSLEESGKFNTVAPSYDESVPAG